MSLQSSLGTKDRFFILPRLIIGLLVLEPILNRIVATGIFLDIFLTAIIS